MKNTRWVLFGSLKLNETFSPIPGTVGSTSVYVKKPNFICPKVGADNEEGIFWPEDRVVPVRIPEVVMKKYL